MLSLTNSFILFLNRNIHLSFINFTYTNFCWFLGHTLVAGLNRIALLHILDCIVELHWRFSNIFTWIVKVCGITPVRISTLWCRYKVGRLSRVLSSHLLLTLLLRMLLFALVDAAWRASTSAFIIVKGLLGRSHFIVHLRREFFQYIVTCCIRKLPC